VDFSFLNEFLYTLQVLADLAVPQLTSHDDSQDQLHAAHSRFSTIVNKVSKAKEKVRTMERNKGQPTVLLPNR
jgi:hypothetical protein